MARKLFSEVVAALPLSPLPSPSLSSPPLPIEQWRDGSISWISLSAARADHMSAIPHLKNPLLSA